ncbi:MAG: hypothetical protein ACYC05_04015 [Sulfuricella sp.]
MGKLSQMLSRASIPLLSLIPPCAEAGAEGRNAPADEGIRFSCKPGRLEAIASGMETCLAALGVAPDLVVKKADRTNGAVVYTLNTPEEDTNALDLKDRPGRFQPDLPGAKQVCRLL